ncbi:MAG: hypothetical protein WCD80_03970 [Desulfobaccales bacterium]
MAWQKKSVFFAVVILVAGLLLGAQAAVAGGLDVSFSVPGSVNAAAAFTITVNVANHTSESITFNKVAAGYVTADMKVKGPYEVYTTSHTLAPTDTTSFIFSFKILYGSGTIVPVAVMLAQDSYQGQNMKGGGVVAVNVN